MKRRFDVTVRGKSGATYGFTFTGDPKHLAEWREDGLEIVEVCNVIPEWAVDIGLTRIWCRLQDAWQWMRLW